MTKKPMSGGAWAFGFVVMLAYAGGAAGFIIGLLLVAMMAGKR